MVRTLSCAVFAASLLGFSFASAKPDESKLKFEVYKGKDNQFRWRLKSSNGQILATGGQGYKVAADARHGVELVQKAGTDSKMKFETYQDAKKEYRWRLKSANGQTIASASEGYSDKSGAEKAIANIKENAAKAEITEVKH